MSEKHWIIELYTSDGDAYTEPDWTPVGEWFFFQGHDDVPMRPKSFERCVRGIQHWMLMGCEGEGEHLRLKDIRTNETIPAEALGL